MVNTQNTTGDMEIYALSTANDLSHQDIIAIGGSNSNQILLIDINNGQTYSRIGPLENIVTGLNMTTPDRENDDDENTKLQLRPRLSGSGLMRLTGVSGHNLIQQFV